VVEWFTGKFRLYAVFSPRVTAAIPPAACRAHHDVVTAWDRLLAAETFPKGKRKKSKDN